MSTLDAKKKRKDDSVKQVSFECESDDIQTQTKRAKKKASSTKNVQQKSRQCENKRVGQGPDFNGDSEQIPSMIPSTTNNPQWSSQTSHTSAVFPASTQPSTSQMFHHAPFNPPPMYLPFGGSIGNTAFQPQLQFDQSYTVMMLGSLTSQVSALAEEVKDLRRQNRKIKRPRLESRDSFESDTELSYRSCSKSPIPPGLRTSLSPTMSEGTQCVLGDRQGRSVIIQGFSQLSVQAKENASADAASLALKLMDLFFTKSELASGCCTEAEGRTLLRPDIIEGIHLHIDYKFPLETRALEERRWNTIIHNNMNGKCRNARSHLKKKEL